MKQHAFPTAFGFVMLLSFPAAAADTAPTLKKDVQPIFDSACAKCHGAKGAKAKLNLAPDASAKSLIGAPSDEVPGLMRVKPGDPDNSYLWQKLQNKAAKGKGMPRGIFTTKRLPDADLATIERWIKAGAPE